MKKSYIPSPLLHFSPVVSATERLTFLTTAGKEIIQTDRKNTRRQYHNLAVDEEQGRAAIFLPGGKVQRTVLERSKPS